MKHRRALVTGGAGFIGSHLSEALLKKGLEVIVYDNLSMGSEDNIPERAKFVEGDIIDSTKFTEALREVDIIFHLAAKVSIRGSAEDFVTDFQNNLEGTVNILSCLAKSTVKKLIYASSMAVYADAHRPGPLPESYHKEPISPYGIAKLASEKYCLMISKRLGVKCAVLRYFNTYGVRQTLTPYVGVINIFINRLLAGKSPVIFGDGQQRRDFVHVKDIVQANLLAMEHINGGEIINIGTGRGTSVEELAHLLKQKINPDIQITYKPKRTEELQNSVADCRKANETINYIPTRQLSENIDEVIDWNLHRFRQGLAAELRP
jgi:UDP-glucose 4-epimerase